MLSVIFPIRAEASTSYLVERLARCLERFAPYEGVECVVVNSASAPAHAKNSSLMIVCSCSMITAKDVEEAIHALRTRDPFVVLTPGLIYRELGKRPSCGSCLPLVSRLMVGYDEEGPSSAASIPHRSPLEQP